MTSSLYFAKFAGVANKTQSVKAMTLTIDVNGATLAALRQLNGYGLKDLADASGVSMSYICEVEKGTKRNVRPATLKKLADALGVTVPVLARDPEAAEKAYRAEVA